MMRYLSLTLIAFMLILFTFSFQELPNIGDPNSPAATHVSPYYIEKAYEDTGASNLVTAVLISYRGFDTLGETIVIFIAGIATMSIISFYYQGQELVRQEERGFGGYVLDTSFRYMVPVVLMYGVYILVHGEYSPGGAFQAGALLAFGVISSQLIRGRIQVITIKQSILLAGFGVLIFLSVGIAGFFYQGVFLELDVLPTSTEELGHAIGILIIEVGVALCVMATILVIYSALEREMPDV
ncbi:hydrogen gas-evolving membrane-bound hydrogenase subunit E [Desulfuribacillus alkaliarsenatis]|uniref:Uncharacterized protein n=1 Tax=Desulfuribacillus alkaliarsenatis TaxID=766136 RepID=A0A1E5G453_9FIRM|nr:hydrogen gas-evolving membrane-bound hydrogenase subunit E [Desulfuribacillus alkaliarsenatis]OEF97862.1 hypothetical protein BHF68_13625 [Desulfuribacillus alkaliarsenatis]